MQFEHAIAIASGFFCFVTANGIGVTLVLVALDLGINPGEWIGRLVVGVGGVTIVLFSFLVVLSMVI